MKRLLALSLLATLCAAQDGASELFYKAFWLEQAGGRTAEAEKLYLKITSLHAASPEAPRALLAIIRIRVAKGHPVVNQLSTLQTRYPAAKEEIAAAKKLARTFKREFDPRIDADDPPAVVKIKSLYEAKFTGSDQDFLVDAGALAHSMLRARLRSTDSAAVRSAGFVLSEQRTDAADRLLAEALTDQRVLFPDVLLYRSRLPQPVLMEAVEKLRARAGVRLRSEIAVAAGNLVRGEGVDARRWTLFTRCLRDEDKLVRESALKGWGGARIEGAPDACIAALLDCAERGDRGVPTHHIVEWADRDAHRDRIERYLKAYPYPMGFGNQPRTVAAQKMMQRVLLARREKYPEHKLAGVLAAWSGDRAADMLADAGVQGDKEFVGAVLRGLGKTPAEKLGAQADRLRELYLKNAYAKDAGKQAAARYVLVSLPWETRHMRMLTAVARVRGGKLPKWVVLDALHKIGADAALAPLIADDQLGAAMRQVRLQLKRRPLDAKTRAFFEACVARARATEWAQLLRLADGYEELRPAVARRLLASPDAAWGWNPPRDGNRVVGGLRRPVVDREKHPGPYIWEREGVGFDLGAELIPHTGDPRRSVALRAVKVAGDTKSDAATAALRKALTAADVEVRGTALVALSKRPVGTEVVRSYLAREDLGDWDRRYARDALRNLPVADATPLLVAMGVDGLSTLRSVNPAVATEEALKIMRSEDADDGARYSALNILTTVADERRIHVFRLVLTGKMKGPVRTVVRTVGDQYLVELGPETLTQLRNPDVAIRQAAKAAVEKLKFYTDAQRSFEAAKGK